MVITAISLAGSFGLFARTTQLHQQGIDHIRASRLATSTIHALKAAGALAGNLSIRCDAGEADACLALARRQQLLQDANQYAGRALPQGTLTMQAPTPDHWSVDVQWQPVLSVRPITHGVLVATQ